MILPIRTLFNREGLISGGVPGELQEAVFDSSGAIVGGPVRLDLVGGSGYDPPAAATPDGGGPDVSPDAAVDAGGLILYSGSAHGAVADSWDGSRESAFDSWRRAGRPRGRRCGMGSSLDDTLSYIAETGADALATRTLAPGTLVQTGPGGQLVYVQPAGSSSNLAVGGGFIQGSASAVTAGGGGALLLLAALATLGVVVWAAKR